MDETRFSPHPFHRVAQFIPELRELRGAYIAPFDPFEPLPEALVRIQLQGIGRQALQVEVLRRAICQELLDGVAAVDRLAIPDEPYPT